jgi:hypothetical protein
LEDKTISGNYSGTFFYGETQSKIEGSFHLIF